MSVADREQPDPAGSPPPLLLLLAMGCMAGAVLGGLATYVIIVVKDAWIMGPVTVFLGALAGGLLGGVSAAIAVSISRARRR